MDNLSANVFNNFPTYEHAELRMSKQTTLHSIMQYCKVTSATSVKDHWIRVSTATHKHVRTHTLTHARTITYPNMLHSLMNTTHLRQRANMQQ